MAEIARSGQRESPLVTRERGGLFPTRSHSFFKTISRTLVIRGSDLTLYVVVYRAIYKVTRHSVTSLTKGAQLIWANDNQKGVDSQLPDHAPPGTGQKESRVDQLHLTGTN